MTSLPPIKSDLELGIAAPEEGNPGLGKHFLQHSTMTLFTERLRN